jgi:hypothetical protein
VISASFSIDGARWGSSASKDMVPALSNVAVSRQSDVDILVAFLKLEAQNLGHGCTKLDLLQ